MTSLLCCIFLQIKTYNILRPYIYIYIYQDSIKLGFGGSKISNTNLQ